MAEIGIQILFLMLAAKRYARSAVMGTFMDVRINAE